VSTPDYEVFPLYGYDVAGEPSGPVDAGPAMGPSSLQVNGQPAGYNLPVDYAGPLLIGSPGGAGTVVLTDPAQISEYRHDEFTRVGRGVLEVGALVGAPFVGAALSTLGGGGQSVPTPQPGVYQVQLPEEPLGDLAEELERATRGVRGQPTNPPPETLPVPYEPPPAVGPGLLVLGPIQIAAGIIGALIESNIPGIGDVPMPNALGSGELPGGPGSVHGPIGDPLGTGQQTPQPPDIELGPVPELIYGPPGEPRPYAVPDIERAPVTIGDPGLAPGVGIGPPPLEPAPVYAPAPVATAPAPAPAPFGIPAWGWGLIGTGIVAAARRRRGRSQNVTPALTSLEDALLESATAPAPGMLSASSPLTSISIATSSGNDEDRCNCHKKRGKPRKCLARAQLTWRSGPKKGKAAGSRCYRYAD